MVGGYIKDVRVATTARSIDYFDSYINDGRSQCSYRVIAESKRTPGYKIYQIAIGHGLYAGGTQFYAVTGSLERLKQAFPLIREVPSLSLRQDSKKEIKAALYLHDEYQWFVGKKKEAK